MTLTALSFKSQGVSKKVTTQKGDFMEVFKLNEIEARELVPGGEVKFVHSENMTLSFWSFKAGTLLPEHAHPHEQILNVMEGTIEFSIEGETEILESVSVVVIPPNVKHSGKTLTDCKVIDVFYPKREDFASLDKK